MGGMLSCVRLYDPKNCSPLGCSVHRISQARILECVAIFFSRGFSQLREQTHVSYVSCIGRPILQHCATPRDAILVDV